MTSSDFQPDRLNLEEILTRRYYRIPRFQRPYSWEPVQLEEFWEDVFLDNDIGYFIGPMVGWRTTKELPHANVVDGQQRLTTVTIALAAIRNTLADLGESKLAEGVHRYIERQDRNNEAHFVLQPEDKAPYLNNGILKYPRDVSASPGNLSERNLAATNAWLTKQISETIAPGGTSLSKDESIKALQGLRDHLLGLYVIWIEHASEDDAYVLFETLNSRGKDLAVADLLKNLLLQKLKAKNTKADAAKDKWDRVRSVLESVDPPIDIDRFIQHWWLSTQEFVAVRKLFGRIKKKIKTSEAAQKNLDSLTADAILYRDMLFPNMRAWTPEEQEIQEALQALTIFNVTQPAPLLLSLLRARSLKSPKMKHLRPSFEAIERYHFQSTTIAASSSSGGISAMYAKYARELTNVSDEGKAIELLKELRISLTDRIPEPVIFDNGFMQLQYSDGFTRDKKLVQYVSRRLHEAKRDHRPKKPTLEHLVPQSSATPDLPIEVIGNIGNLLWVDENLNGELSHKSFTEKKTILSRFRELYDIDDILEADEWGSAQIEARAQRLAVLARNEVWLLGTKSTAMEPTVAAEGSQ